eukprot:210159_1
MEITVADSSKTNTVNPKPPNTDANGGTTLPNDDQSEIQQNKIPDIVAWYMKLVGLDIQAYTAPSPWRTFYKAIVIIICITAIILIIVSIVTVKRHYASAIQITLYFMNSILTWLALHRLITFSPTSFQHLLKGIIDLYNVKDNDNMRRHLIIYLLALYSAVLFVNIYVFTPKCLGHAKMTLYDYCQSFVTTIFNISSIYTLDIILLFLCLLFVRNIDIFIQRIEDGTISEIEDCKRQLTQLHSNMKEMRKELGFIVSFAFITHLCMAGFLTFLYLAHDHEGFSKVSWCVDPIMSFMVEFILRATRLGALIYGPMLVNTKSHAIPRAIVKHLKADDCSKVMRFYLSVDGDTPIFRICWMDIYWGRFIAFVVGCFTTLFAAFVKSAV